MSEAFGLQHAGRAGAGPDPEARFALAVRAVEALVFAARAPVSEAEMGAILPAGVPLPAVLAELVARYQERGVNFVRLAGKWTFRTAPDLAHLLAGPEAGPRKLTRTALETLAIIAYHQPVTRAEIEQIRGVSTAKGTLDALLEAGFIRWRGRRRTPGRPLTIGTTEAFLVHFGLDRISDLPSLEDLEQAGLLEGALPPRFPMPSPYDGLTLTAEEDPLEPDLFDMMAEARVAEEEAQDPLENDRAPEPSDEEAPQDPRAIDAAQEPLDHLDPAPGTGHVTGPDAGADGPSRKGSG